jgi:hypothetical protein
MYVAAAISAACLVSIACKSKIVKNWISDKKKKAGIVFCLVETLFTNKSTECCINDTNQSATVLYNRLGKKSTLFVPFNRNHVAQMISFKAELIFDGKPSLNITQQPGIPYMVDAKSLGGLYIKITNEENGQSKLYGTEEVPHYAEELFE